MNEMEIRSTPLEGVFVIRRNLFIDERGVFARLFTSMLIKKNHFEFSEIRNINYSKTHSKGTIRGLHYQKFPHSETKIISCLNGSILDIVIDLRTDSKTYLTPYSIILNEGNGLSLVVPKGFAHGFQTLENNVLISYMTDEYYKKSHEFGINPIDPYFNIDWPVKPIIMSDQDRHREFWPNKL